MTRPQKCTRGLKQLTVATTVINITSRMTRPQKCTRGLKLFYVNNIITTFVVTYDPTAEMHKGIETAICSSLFREELFSEMTRPQKCTRGLKLSSKTCLVLLCWLLSRVYDPTAEMHKGIETSHLILRKRLSFSLYDPTAEMHKGIETISFVPSLVSNADDPTAEMHKGIETFFFHHQ